MELAMIEDRIVAIDSLEPAYLDRGVFFGDGVYEVLRSYEGKIFALEDHLARFENSLKAIGIANVDIEQIRTRVTKAFNKAEIANARIYFHITRGSARRSHSYGPELKPNFFLTVEQVSDDTEFKRNGIAVSTHPDWRWKRCDIKSLNLLANILARQDAVSKGCKEAILIDDDGMITEGAGSAFFAVFDGSLYTTPLTGNVLPSITRKYVVMAANNLGLELTEKSITPARATKADELFIAVTTKDIVPVVTFDGESIGSGSPGQITKKITAEFNKFTGRKDL